MLSDLIRTMDAFLGDLQFGEPWKLDEKKGGMVVPLLRQRTGHELRGYVVLEEVKDNVVIRDLGSIDRVQMRSSFDRPVFVRGGGILKGQSTQSRGIQFGVIIVPDQEQVVPVRCVHASRGIVGGDVFSLHCYAPSSLTQALQSDGQAATWHRLSRWTSRSDSGDRSRAGERVELLREIPLMVSLSEHSACERDNLVRAIDLFKSEVDEALRKVPGDLPSQVGMAILSEGSVVGVEAFDDPVSWMALSKSVVRQYTDVLDKEDLSNWSVDRDELVRKIRLFFGQVDKSKAEEAFRNDVSRTLLFQDDGIVGECTLFHDAPIHFLLTSSALSE